jgi:acyl carrier protein
VTDDDRVRAGSTALADDLIALIADDVGTRADEPIDEHTDLLLSGIVDSLGVFRIVQWLEERTGITVEPVDVTLENFQSVAAVVRFVAARHAATSA